MATSTPTLVNLVKAELEAHLPTLLTAESLDTPKDYVYGPRRLVPTTQTPLICVDIPDWDQEGATGGQGRRNNDIIVYAVLADADEETLHQNVHTYMDLITKVLEAEVASSGAKIVVTAADSTGALEGIVANALIRVCSVEGRLRKVRARGDA